MNFEPAASRMVLRFGTFEVDVRAGELRKRGVKVKIQDQPFQILRALLQRPGEVVSRDELRAQLWRPDTFVDFDKGLNTSVNKLREVLGDTADNPRFVETLPRRGYRFIAPVLADGGEMASTGHRKAVTIGPRAIAVAAAVLVAGAAWSVESRLRHRQPASLSEKDTIVLADITNATGDPVFDATLRQGLAVELEQSPSLSLVPEADIQQTLRLMRHSPDDKITPELAWEICQRTASTIELDGTIAQVGTAYTLLLRARDCANGRSLTSTEAQARDKDHVLDALGRASSDIRRKLGESSATVQKFDTTLAQATTPSLEALQFYTLGYKALVGRGDSAAAIPLFREAIRRDPKFAMAYALLGDASWNVGETMVASESIRKAYELRAGVSEPERFRIESAYHSVTTGELEKARADLEVWTDTYPRDCGPRNEQGVIDSVLGQHDRAHDVFVDALRLCPQSGLIRGNLVYSLIALGRFQEARAALGDAKATNVQSPGLRIAAYRLAFLDNDTTTMESAVSRAAGAPGLEDELLWNRAATTSYYGRWTQAMAFDRQAIDAATRAGETEEAAGYEADAAWRAALFDLPGESRERAASALRMGTGPNVLYDSGLALAISGDTTRARTIAEGLDARFPADTIVRSVFLPTLNAQLALARNDYRKAIAFLEPTLPYESGTAALYPAYVRGLALLAGHQPGAALAEFEKIARHRGVVLNSVIGPLTQRQTARALLMQQDVTKARAAYRSFLDLWKAADPDLPVLRRARVEFQRVQ